MLLGEILAEVTPNDLLRRTVQQRDCSLWRGATVKGVGVVVENFVSTTARRKMYELTYGPLLDNRHVFVSCGNRDCIAPAHLFLKPKKPATRPWEKRMSNIHPDEIKKIREEFDRGCEIPYLCLLHKRGKMMIKAIVERR